LYDIDGNAAEWVNDWYSAKGSSEFSADQLIDPLGPDIGEFHVVRGGSWAKGYLPTLRLAYRDYAAKGKHDIGFRIARYAGLNKK
jgi:formylglycine-generating enzyme required for sulfatase activity